MCQLLANLAAPGPLLLLVTANLWILLAVLDPAAAVTTPDVIKMEEYVPERHSGPVGTVPYNGTYLYLPAPPGKSPRCARGGRTYCSEIPAYPSDVIGRLLKRWKYDLSSVFVSESRQTLTGSPPQIPPRRRGSRPRNSQRRRSFFGQSASAASRWSQIGARNGSILANRKSLRLGPGHSSQPIALLTPRRHRDRTGNSFRSYGRRRRQADDSQAGSQLCPTSGQFVTPKAGLTTGGEWRFVVNTDEEDGEQQYTQLVRVESCLSDRCLGLCTVPAGMEASCQQQYVQKKMVGLDPSGSQMYTDLYWLPHCCVCQIR